MLSQRVGLGVCKCARGEYLTSEGESMSSGRTIPDSQISKSVNQKLMQRGSIAGCKLTATVANGQVTIVGTVENEHQKKPIISALNGISGVRRVIDQSQVVARKKRE